MKIYVQSETPVVDFVEELANLLLTEYPEYNIIQNEIEFDIILADDHNNVFDDVNSRAVFTDEGVTVFR